MAFIDYYEVLGIEKSATIKEIKAAYKKLARQFHPDLNHDNTEVPQNMFVEGLHKIKMQHMVYGMTNSTAKACVKSNQFKEAERCTLCRGIYKVQKSQSDNPGYLFEIFYHLVFCTKAKYRRK